VLAKALEGAYSDIFLAHIQAQSLPFEKLKGIIASKTTKGEATVERIARTFQVLAKAADFSVAPEHSKPSEAKSEQVPTSKEPEQPAIPSNSTPLAKFPGFHYNIEIHLPTTTDITVYNAIFKSLKENLF